MNVKLIAKTVLCNDGVVSKLNGDNSPEALVQYTARVSNPNNQTSNNSKLLEYCAKHKHWSIFEQADFTFEITTSRAIAAQILRHRSFTFQEFSQRYSQTTGFELYDARRQDLKNKQNSIDDISEEDKEWFIEAQRAVNIICEGFYKDALDKGIAKECARFMLPLSTQTVLYMKGNIRSWIHYLEVRTGPETQLEHREIALAIKEQLKKEIPTIAEALGWV